MTEPLPTFRFHPDPLATGSCEVRPVDCLACEQERPVTYVGPVFAVEELDEELCPWCIADGTAARLFGASFTDAGWDDDSGVSDDDATEVLERTPGYAGWQQEVWLHHCGSPALYLGRAGADRLAEHPDAVAAVRTERGWPDGPDAGFDAYLAALTPDGSPTAYLFRCAVCGGHLARTDVA